MARRRPRLLVIPDFSDDIIAEVFKFVGRGHFLFLAGTSRQFHRVYKAIYGNENDSTAATAMTSAVESISRLQWARANGCPWDWRTCRYAAKHGQLEVLQWARTNGCPWGELTCAYAAWNGHLEVLQWARANGCPWYSDTCSYAARNGHLEVLQWARANGCDWGWDTCANAAENGHLEVLQWSRANGCPWNENTCANAALNGQWQEPMIVHGTKTLVPSLPRMGIWRCCSGPERMDAHRMKKTKILRRGLRRQMFRSAGGE